MVDDGDGKWVHLPAARAFVVQFAAALPRHDAFRGRVEHLATGQVEHFDSLERLAAFFACTLRDPPAETGEPRT